MFVKLRLQCSTVSPILWITLCNVSPLVNLLREQVKSLSSIVKSVVSLSDLKKGEENKWEKQHIWLCLTSDSQKYACVCRRK